MEPALRRFSERAAALTFAVGRHLNRVLLSEVDQVLLTRVQRELIALVQETSRNVDPFLACFEAHLISTVEKVPSPMYD